MGSSEEYVRHGHHWTIKALVAEETGTSFIGKSTSGEYFQQYTKLDSQTPDRV